MKVTVPLVVAALALPVAANATCFPPSLNGKWDMYIRAAPLSDGPAEHVCRNGTVTNGAASFLDCQQTNTANTLDVVGFLAVSRTCEVTGQLTQTASNGETRLVAVHATMDRAHNNILGFTVPDLRGPNGWTFDISLVKK